MVNWLLRRKFLMRRWKKISMLETFDLLIFREEECLKKINISDFPTVEEIEKQVLANGGTHAYVAKRYDVVPFM